MGGSPTLSECADYDGLAVEEKAEAPQVEESTGAVANSPRSGSSAGTAATADGAGSPGSDDSDCECMLVGRPHLQRISADEWRRTRAARASSAATAESAAATSPAAGAAPDANRGASDVDPEAVDRAAGYDSYQRLRQRVDRMERELHPTQGCAIALQQRNPPVAQFGPTVAVDWSRGVHHSRDYPRSSRDSTLKGPMNLGSSFELPKLLTASFVKCFVPRST
ncbi:hypothetical protein P43SY_008429 [Pythium insidiosum]|uniref:Uncharacterized protein n=1 Tax=Pythium insidiosum TaxID=114742 RepID=A0AAD5LUA1_PYTIN|nr:hypothetical protein P43SY_008429 [Pythium insidiosum]